MDGYTPNTITPRQFMAHTHYMGLSGSALRTAIGLVSGLCFVAFGYGQGDIGGLMVMPSFRHEFPQMDVVQFPILHVANTAGIVVASWNLGCFAGAMVTVFTADLLGRRGSIIFGLCVMIIGKVIQASSFSLGQYVAGRVVAGFGNGFIASTVPAWQAECLKTHRRGTLLLVSFGSCITAGLAIAYWIDYGFSWAEPASTSWRPPIAIGLIFMLLPLLIILFMPESPRFLVLCGREQQAKSVFSALNELSPDDEDVHREFLMVKHTLLHMASGGIMQAFTMGRCRYAHRTILAVALQIMQQFTGVNLFMQYLGSMFVNQLRFKPETGLLLGCCCTTAFFLASLVSVIGIDRFWGRRTLTIFGASGMLISMIVLCCMDWWGAKRAFYVMAAFIFLYCISFSIGWQGMSWLWAVELIPLSIRGPANALATAANWLSNFIVVMATPALFTNTKYRTYIVFAITNFLIIPTIYFLYPETGYRSLEEVDVLFNEASNSAHPWFAMVTVTRKEQPSYNKNSGPSDSYACEPGGGENSEKGFAKAGASRGKHTSNSQESNVSNWDQSVGNRESSVGSQRRQGSRGENVYEAASPRFLISRCPKWSEGVTSLGPGAM